ncbi:MAG TPA: hypothetical protein VGF69_10270 [Thermoanaerobaculia bacterium]|jgi:hypothetical protein
MRSDPSHPGPSPTLAALRNLRPSGDKSFEALVARLLVGISGVGVRLCQAGTQGGVDAIADIPFAVEAKRHKNEVPTRELLGGLANAALRYRHLELWVLAATTTVGAQAAADLRRHGEAQGLGTLLLDTSTSAQLPEIGQIVALAATDINITASILSDPAWRGGGEPPDIESIRTELTAIRDQPTFAVWKSQLEKSLRDLPTWQRFVQNHNADLRERIIRDAQANFVTPFDVAEAIPRDAESQLTTWLNDCAATDACPIAVVVGDRYDGKTWLVYRWLSENLSQLTLPVFFFSSDDVKMGNGQLDAMIEAQVRRGMRQFSQHATAMIERQKQIAEESSRPWCAIVLDGANEYATDAAPFRMAVATAVPVSAAAAQMALIVTWRRNDFEDSAWWLGNRSHSRVELGPFNVPEFAEALARNSLSTKDIDEWPEEARDLMRHPRYFGLSVRFWKELPLFGFVTADVLHFLDVSEKVIPRSPGVQLRPEALQAMLAGLAEEWLKQRKLSLKAVRSRVAEVTEHIDASVQNITSRGILTRQNGLFALNGPQFEFGMGLLIRDTLLNNDDAAFGRMLEELLQPHRSDDEKVRWLRAAVAASAVAGDTTTRPEVLDFLLSEWLSARNFSTHDLDDLRNLVPLVLGSVLRLLSFGQPVHKKIVTVAEPIIRLGIERNETAVAHAVRKWFRIIPAGAYWFIGDQGAAPPEVELVPSDPSLRDLELTVADRRAGQSVRALQRLGLSLAWEFPALVKPNDVLALIAGRRAVGGYLDDSECLAIRRILATSDVAWYETEVLSSLNEPDAPRVAALRELIQTTRRADLADLLTRLPQRASPAIHRKRFSREELLQLRGTGDFEQTLREAQNAAHLALDPESPAPAKTWRAKLAHAAVERFAGSQQLHTGRMTSLDDHDLEKVEPTLAAWAPKAGARIWRAFFADIPRRIHASDPAWSWVLAGHLPLLKLELRRELLRSVLHAVPKVESMDHALECGYACIVAQASASERIRLLLQHPFEGEPHDLYEPLALGHDEALQQKAVAAARTERDPLRRQRSRFLLVWLGGMALTPADVKLLIADIATHGGIARLLLKESRLAEGTPPEVLAPFAEVAQGLADTAFQYEAFLLSRTTGMQGLTAAGVVCALAAPQTARANGASTDVSDEIAVAQGLQQLAVRITDHLSNPDTMGRSQQFPKSLAGDVPQEVFETWVRLLLASPVYAHLRHSGLLVPVVHHALRTAHPAALQLWQLVYPFHRGQAMGTRFVDNDGLNSMLSDLNDPALDNDTARTILLDLVRDSRSNSELIQVALSARAQPARLMSVIDELLSSGEELDRARARFVLGWMPDSADSRARLTRADSSRWVNELGQAAVHRLERERWARHWLARFLFDRLSEHRWAAGRLFLACSDVATPFWARRMIWKASAASAVRRAEASLLLGRVRKKPDDSGLRDYFLGYRVRDLEHVIPPWRRALRWADIEISDKEEED